mgnify:CR=1 FL=1
MELFLTITVVLVSVAILLAWVYVRSVEREEEHALYDKNKVKYTDGDNT